MDKCSLFGTNKIFFGTNTVVFGTNTDVFETNTVVFGDHNVVFGTNTVIFGTYTESLLRTFFEQQMNTRKPKDWATQILKDLNDFGIYKNLNEI